MMMGYTEGYLIVTAAETDVAVDFVVGFRVGNVDEEKDVGVDEVMVFDDPHLPPPPLLLPPLPLPFPPPPLLLLLLLLVPPEL